MIIKRALIKFFTKKKYQAFIDDTKQPKQVVNALWQDEIYPLLKKSSYWRKKLPLEQYQNISDFDISDYQDYQAELEQALSSTLQPFNGEEILFWSETSATTGKRKYFPITQSFQMQFQRTMAPYFYSLLARFPSFLTGKIVYLAAWDTNQLSAAKTKMGLISNYNYNHLPALIRSFYAIPAEVLRDKETFIKWAPVYALATDLSTIFAVVPITIDEFYQRCAKRFNELLPYLLNEKSLPSDLPKLNISKQRQKYLKSLDKNEIHSYQQLWPSLSLTGCWIEGPCKPFSEKLKNDLGQHIQQLDGTFSATEGWLTVPIDVSHRGGVFHPRTHIVEFIEENLEIDKKNLIDSWQLEVGKRYEVFLTTAMGFVRYRLKDIVECTGFYNQSPILVFCYKASQLLLDYCALSEADLRLALDKVELLFKSYWYFACDQNRDRLLLIVDEESAVANNIAEKIHMALIDNNDKYAYEVGQNNILACQLVVLPKEKLLENQHAQTKPKLISQDILVLE